MSTAILSKDEMIEKAEQALNNIRPYLEADGGDVKIVGLEDDFTLNVELLGACETCPMSSMTMKAGIEEAVKKAIPEIKRIKAINVA